MMEKEERVAVWSSDAVDEGVQPNNYVYKFATSYHGVHGLEVRDFTLPHCQLLRLMFSTPVAVLSTAATVGAMLNNGSVFAMVHSLIAHDDETVDGVYAVVLSGSCKNQTVVTFEFHLTDKFGFPAQSPEYENVNAFTTVINQDAYVSFKFDPSPQLNDSLLKVVRQPSRGISYKPGTFYAKSSLVYFGSVAGGMFTYATPDFRFELDAATRDTPYMVMEDFVSSTWDRDVDSKKIVESTYQTTLYNKSGVHEYNLHLFVNEHVALENHSTAMLKGDALLTSMCEDFKEHYFGSISVIIKNQFGQPYIHKPVLVGGGISYEPHKFVLVFNSSSKRTQDDALRKFGGDKMTYYEF